VQQFANVFFIFSAKYLFVAPIIIVGGYFLRRSWPTKKQMIVFALPALVLTYAVGLVGNHVYVDPRPFVVGHFTPLVPHTPDNGFPSDHTLLVSALAAVGFYWQRTLGGVLAALALIVAVARVDVGLHHPIDVIGSIVIAAVTTSLVFVVLKYVAPKTAV